MKKSWKDRAISKLVHIGKKHKILKYPLILCIFIIVGIHFVFESITCNTKKIVGLACLTLFFMVSSSFASIAFIPTTEELANGDSMEADTANSDEKVASDDATMAILDDNDVIDGYEDSNLENVKTDYYSVDEILNENEIEVTKELINQQNEVKKEDTAVIDKDDWKLLLINKQHPIPDGYEFELGVIKGNMKCDERIIEDLLQMLQGAKNDGVNLVICSPYRDMNRQEVLFNRKIELYMKKGMSYLEAYKTTAQAVTVPGASEHQIGLALDIICDYYSQLNAGFGDTEAGKWLAKHSCEYGFILRYPKGKEYITSIEYEPWHFRYVGKEAAMEITQKGITLEEFVESL